MLRCLKYTSLNSKLLVIYFANFVELGGYCPKTGYFRFLSFIPNSCHKTLINVTFERGSEKVTFFPWFWYMILPTTNNELGNKTRKKEKMGGYYPGWRYFNFTKIGGGFWSTLFFTHVKLLIIFTPGGRCEECLNVIENF